MATLDIILLILFIPAIIRGISKGFMEQAMALFTLVIAGRTAYGSAGMLSAKLSEKIIVNDTVLYIISFVVIVIVCVVVFNLFSKLLTKLADSLSLGGVNRTLGVILALFNTALILGLIFSAFNSLNETMLHIETPWLEESVIYKWDKALCDVVFPYFKNVTQSAI